MCSRHVVARRRLYPAQCHNRLTEGGALYESNGEKYFIVDSHMHYWNAAPDNWVPGAEQYAKGWIECFHAYQGLGPPETHWSIEHFQKYSEDDLMKDVRSEERRVGKEC